MFTKNLLRVGGLVTAREANAERNIQTQMHLQAHICKSADICTYKSAVIIMHLFWALHDEGRHEERNSLPSVSRNHSVIILTWRVASVWGTCVYNLFFIRLANIKAR